nr:rhomboid family intramembrane serine protease [uncultured Blautia sp.]
MEEIKKEPVTVLFILLNVLIFLIVDFSGGSENTAHMIECGAAYPPLILENGQVYRLFTSMFLHFGIYHIANNMLILFVLGQRLEPVVGKIRFILIYLLGGLGGNIFSIMMEMKKSEYAVSAGASGAIFSIMGAMLYVVLRNRGKLQDISVRQMLIMAGFSLYFGFTSTGVDNAAHIGGLICGFLLAVLLYHPRRATGRRIWKDVP